MAPVTYELRTKASTPSAMSSGVAERWRGALADTVACSASQSDVQGVATSPGATALKRTGPCDLASSWAILLSAVLVMEYAIELPEGRTPATEVTKTTLP